MEKITLEDCNDLLQAVEYWEQNAQPDGGAIKKKIFEKLAAEFPEIKQMGENAFGLQVSSEEEADAIKGKFDDRMREMLTGALDDIKKEKDKAEEIRKEKCAFLRVKIYDLRNQIRLEKSLAGSKVVSPEA